MKTQLLFQVVITFFAKTHFSVFKNFTAGAAVNLLPSTNKKQGSLSSNVVNGNENVT